MILRKTTSNRMLLLIFLSTILQPSAATCKSGETDCQCCDAGKYGYDGFFSNDCYNCPTGKWSKANCMLDVSGDDTMLSSCTDACAGANAKFVGGSCSTSSGGSSSSMSGGGNMCKCNSGSFSGSCSVSMNGQCPCFDLDKAATGCCGGSCSGYGPPAKSSAGTLCSSNSDCTSGYCKVRVCRVVIC